MKLLNFLVPSSVLMLKAFGENDESLAYTATALGFSIEAMKPFLKAAADMAADTLKDSASKVVDDIDAERTSHLIEAIINAQKSTLKAIEKEVVQELQILETGKETIYRLLLNRAGEKRETYEQMMLDFFLPLQSVLNNENNILAMLEGHQQLQPDDYVTQAVRNNLPAYVGTDRELFVADIAARFRKHYPHHFLQQLKKDNKAKTVYFTITLEALLRGGIEQKAMLSELKENVLLVIAELRSELPRLAELGKLIAELNTTTKSHLDRLSKKLDEQSEPYLINNDFSEEGKSTDNKGLLFDYKYQYTTFVGRNAEMSKLQSFLESERYYCWWMIVGPGGMGKSRMALEIIKAAKGKGWNAGFYNQRNAHDWSHWNATEPTFLVLDYALTDIDTTTKLLSDIDNRSPRFKQKVRVLLLERNVNDNWKQALIKPGIRRSAFGSADSNWLELKELDSIWLIIEDVVNRSELSLDDKQSLLSNEKQIMDDLYQIDPQRRPLFAFFAAKALVYSEGKSVRGWNVDHLLEFHLTRLETEYWAKSEVYRNNALSFKKLLLTTTLCRQIPVDTMQQLEKELHLPADSKPVYALLTDDKANENNERGYYTGLQPDILAGYFIITTLNALAEGRFAGMGKEDADTLLQKAWGLHSLGCVQTIYLLWQDYLAGREIVLVYELLKCLEDNIHNQSKLHIANLSAIYAGIGEMYYNRKEFSTSLEFYDKAVYLQPSDSQAHYNRGVVRDALGDKKGALSDYNEAILLQPDFAYAYNNRGGVKNTLGEKEGALSDYSKAILLQPDFAHAYYNRGLVKNALGDREGALSDYTEAIHLQPDDPQAYNNRGSVKSSLGDLDGALSDYNYAIRLQPDFTPAYYNRGALRDALGDREGAISDCTEAIRLQPDYAPAYYNRGVVRDALGDRQGALSDLNEAIRLQPSDPAAYNNRGVVKNALGECGSALSDYSEAIRLQPDYVNAYHNRGVVRDNLGDREGALSDYSEAIRLQPDYAPGYNNRGIMRLKMADYVGAIHDFNALIRISPYTAPAYYLRGICYHSLSNERAACADFKKALDMGIEEAREHYEKCPGH